MAKGIATKTKRGPLTPEEIDQMVEKYRADTHSLSDLSREYNSNPTTVSRALRDRGVKFRPPGPTEFQRQKQIKLYALRKEQARAYETYAENIKKTEARVRREERAARKAAEAEEQYQAWVN